MPEKGTHGGKREGAGRKVGARTVRTRIVARQLEKREETPLHVLISTMVAFWEEAQRTAETQPKLALMREAAAIAEKAAPYIHARLASVSATIRKVSSIRDLSDEELLAIAASAGAEEGEEVVDESAELVN